MNLPFIILAIASIVFGAIIGSFLNVVVYRYGTGHSIVHDRSRCMRCRHVLSPLDLVPIFSFLALKGKCRYCKTTISLQYPVIETIASVVSLGVLYTTSNVYQFIFWFVVWMVLLFIAIYDIKHTIIPWQCLFILVILSIARLIFIHAPLSVFFEGLALAAPLLFISFISKSMWMGWGDGLLELSLAWFLGLSMGLTALLLSFWIGAIIGILLLLASKQWKVRGSRFTMKSEIPFAPFLIIGMAIVYFIHVDFFSSFTGFFS